MFLAESLCFKLGYGPYRYPARQNATQVENKSLVCRLSLPGASAVVAMHQ